jgi:Uncharacterized conserved protein (DUF2278)
MPVQNYGVVVGQFDHFDRDDANHYGNYYHGHIFVRVGAGADAVLYNCACDVKYPTGYVEYFEPSKLDQSLFASVAALTDGYHPLAPNPSSGAIDYVRDRLISEPLGCVAIVYAVLRWFTGRNYQVWKQNVGMSALSDLEAFLAADGGIARIYVFGAEYHNAAQNPPQGMHDVHLNQGDPPPVSGGPNYQLLDGIWQDGGVVVQRPSGALAGFFVKFLTQTLRTNDQGLPA